MKPYGQLKPWPILTALFVVFLILTVRPESAVAQVDYLKDVKPILQQRCYSCHSRLKRKSELRLDAGVLIHKGGKHGLAIVAGKGSESPLVQKVLSTDESERMPPEGKLLSAEQISLLKAWIDQGAHFPKDEKVPPLPSEHWAFQPVRRPAVPGVRNTRWLRNEIDNFVLAKLEARSWQPTKLAKPQALLRRAYLDLIGLPPTLAEQDQFLKSPSDAALDKVIAELLAHPNYGERWGRHWLDLVRYAETNGYERDDIKPFVWRYRDYVIRALNADKPFDRFIVEQLAGDELPEANAETMIATGYNRLGPWDDEPADPATDRYDQLDDLVSTTAQVFLGLTLGCARCHDHKFEPLATTDYYSMVAIFNPLKRSQNGRTELTLPVGTRKEIMALAERDRAIDSLQKEIAALRTAFTNEFLTSGKSKLSGEVIQAFQIAPDKRNETQKKLVADSSKALDDEIATAMSEEFKHKLAPSEQQISKLREAMPDLPRGYFLHEPSAKPPVTHVLMRGSPNRPGAEVGPTVPAILVKQQPEFSPPGEQTSRRRLTLARWIASPENALTARVIVNRVWQLHFATGLVRTPSDFGVMGEPPTHPELLDWLAHWFVHDAKWSLKELHRLIMASNTWRMSRDSNPKYAAADPENRLLWRMPYRRLEVEAIRDSMLAVSGQLSPTMFGPSMYPEVPRQALEGSSDPDKIWKPFDEKDTARRTIYAFIKRSMIVPMLEVLDLCDTTQTSAQRAVTTVAPQALTLFNGDFVNRQARHLANRLVQAAGDNPQSQIQIAYRLALCRLPTTAELKAMLEFKQNEAERLMRETANSPNPLGLEAARKVGLEQMCRVVLNLNEFVYSD